MRSRVGPSWRRTAGVGVGLSSLRRAARLAMTKFSPLGSRRAPQAPPPQKYTRVPEGPKFSSLAIILSAALAAAGCSFLIRNSECAECAPQVIFACVPGVGHHYMCVQKIPLRRKLLPSPAVLGISTGYEAHPDLFVPSAYPGSTRSSALHAQRSFRPFPGETPEPLPPSPAPSPRRDFRPSEAN